MRSVLTAIGVLVAQAGFGTAASAATTLSALTLNRSVVAGCQNVTGTVRLTEPAPAGGLRVTLSDTLLSATVPLTLTLPQGALSKNFIVSTTPVSAARSGKISASFAGTTLSQDLAVRPMGLSSLILSPTSVASGHRSIGTVTLECKAGPGPVTVALSSSNPAIATPVATSVVVSAGLQSQPFDITTSALSTTSLTITGRANGISKAKTLRVTPAATVTLTSLAFGEVKDYDSAHLTTRLLNKGTAPYAVVGITVTSAGSFSQSNQCPASLAAGASCTILVTFRPGLGSARSGSGTPMAGILSIATTATSSPLRVKLTGTSVCSIVICQY